MAETKKKNQTEYPMALPIGTTLKGGQYPYRIEEVLGQGSYGHTYRVSAQVPIGNITKEVSFAVKENFTKKYCSRKADGVTMKYPTEFTDDVERDLQDFMSEGNKLREICKESENIVKVNETWRENGTAYYAMEHIDGSNLCDYVKDHGCLSEKEAIDILLPVIDAVGVIHQHRLLHLDIKPENIMLEKRKDGGVEPILIDFGITLHFDNSGTITQTSKDHSIGCSDGYAPIEQYGGVNHFAPEVDVYALGATLYYMLVGEDPKRASEIKSRQIESGLPQDINEKIKNAILHAMKGMAEDRTQTTTDFKNELIAKTETSDSYRLKIRYSGNGSVLRNNKALKNGSTYKVKNNSSKSITILPDKGYKVENIKLNGKDITNLLNGNTLNLIGEGEDVDLTINFAEDDSTVEVGGTVKYDRKEVTIKSTGNGSVSYGNAVIRNSSRSFKVKYSSSFNLSFSPDRDNKIKSIKVNNVHVTSKIYNNQYTIDNIKTDTVVDVIFEKEEVVVSPDPEPNNLVRNFIIGVSVVVMIFILYNGFNSGSCTSNQMSTTSNIEEVVDSMRTKFVSDYVIEESPGVSYTYSGDLVGGVPEDDNATAKYPDNDPYGRLEYNGGFSGGKRNTRNSGNATLTYKNGDRYVGSFVDNNFDRGTYIIKKDGQYFKGIFKNGQPYNGTWFNKSEEKISEVVYGVEK